MIAATARAFTTAPGSLADEARDLARRLDCLQQHADAVARRGWDAAPLRAEVERARAALDAVRSLIALTQHV